MSTHTPGPWSVWEEETRHGDFKIRAVGSVIGAVWKQSNGIGDANARLIAKAPIAPKLAEALRLALSVIPNDAMVYSEGDHGERVYPADVARAALAEWDAQS